MAAERQLPRGQFVNETGSRQAQASEVYIVETQAAGGTVSGVASGNEVTTSSVVGSSLAASSSTGNAVVTSSVTGSALIPSVLSGDIVTTASIVGEGVTGSLLTGNVIVDASIVGTSLVASSVVVDEVTTASIVGSSLVNSVATGDQVTTASFVGDAVAAGSSVLSGTVVATATVVGSSIAEALATGGVIVNTAIFSVPVVSTSLGAGSYRNRGSKKKTYLVDGILRELTDAEVAEIISQSVKPNEAPKKIVLEDKPKLPKKKVKEWTIEPEVIKPTPVKKPVFAKEALKVEEERVIVKSVVDDFAEEELIMHFIRARETKRKALAVELTRLLGGR